MHIPLVSITTFILNINLFTGDWLFSLWAVSMDCLHILSYVTRVPGHTLAREIVEHVLSFYELITISLGVAATSTTTFFISCLLHTVCLMLNCCITGTFWCVCEIRMLKLHVKTQRLDQWQSLFVRFVCLHVCFVDSCFAC